MSQQKRQRPTIGLNSKKRPKLDSSGAGPRPAKKISSANALAWKDVSMPDRMDDYEGFFGLEEIDDVDVVREAGSGKINFVTKDSKPLSLRKSKEPSNLEDNPSDAEWSGFDDEEVEVAKKAPPKAKKREKTKQPRKPIGKDANGSSGNQEQEKTGFQILTEDADNEDGVDVSRWNGLKLSPDTMASLSRLKFSKPSGIQALIIPEILSGHDVIGKASTGSGKTLAFGIPILERFLEVRSRRLRVSTSARKTPLALILSPTRELAHQLDKHLRALCSNGIFEGPLIATLTGGLSMQKQQRLLKDADIIIGTPGRLWEVIGSGRGILEMVKQIQFLVLDEADRLLSEGHFKEVEEILDALDREADDEADDAASDEKTESSKAIRQTLVFSATFDRSLQKKLAAKGRAGNDLMSKKESMEYLLSKLRFREENPKFVDANPVNQLAAGLKEGLIECVGTEKDLYLYGLLLLHQNTRALVFCNSIDAVRRITPLLQNLDMPAVALHSGMVQKARLRSVERFTGSSDGNKTQASILIATDVAARGLDIPNVQLVIHYHLPRTADTYVHRSGRTARAGQQGSSILICAPEEVAGVRRLVAKVHAQAAITPDSNTSDAAKQGFYIRTLDIDRRVISRLKPRTTLAKKLADATIATEKQHKEDDFMRAAAEELGVEYDSEEFEKQATGRRGRGAGRKQKEREARSLSKADIGAVRAELRDLLKQRVNVGVSEKYLTSGNVDVDELLRQQEANKGKTGEFLGRVEDLGLGNP